MIKLFENYYPTEPKIGLLKMTKKFFFDIKGDEHKIIFNLENNNKMLFIKVYNDQQHLICTISFSSTRELWITTTYNDPIFNGNLVKYFYNIVSPHFTINTLGKKYSSIDIHSITQEILDKIKFNKLDYEMFNDTERFGL